MVKQIHRWKHFLSTLNEVKLSESDLIQNIDFAKMIECGNWKF